jgi:hypothetical protein
MAKRRKLIGEFLSELADHPKKMREYLADREKAMRDAGLDHHQRQILLSNDLHRIRDAIHEEYATAQVLLFGLAIQVITAHDPGQVITAPDPGQVITAPDPEPLQVISVADPEDESKAD